MTDISGRVRGCFANVFPSLRDADIPGASPASVAAWDSIAHITLLAAIAEEFGVEFSPDEFEELTSFEAITENLERR